MTSLPESGRIIHHELPDHLWSAPQRRRPRRDQRRRHCFWCTSGNRLEVEGFAGADLQEKDAAALGLLVHGVGRRGFERVAHGRDRAKHGAFLGADHDARLVRDGAAAGDHLLDVLGELLAGGLDSRENTGEHIELPGQGAFVFSGRDPARELMRDEPLEPRLEGGLGQAGGLGQFGGAEDPAIVDEAFERPVGRGVADDGLILRRGDVVGLLAEQALGCLLLLVLVVLRDKQLNGIEALCLPGVRLEVLEAVTNAMSEGLNSKIQKIKSMACGFRNIENFKTAIYFRCGGLELYPC